MSAAAENDSLALLKCMLDGVAAVPLIEAVMGGSENKGLTGLNSNNFELPSGISFPSRERLRSNVEAVLNFSSSNEVLKFLPKMIDGVDAVNFVAALALYTQEEPFPYYRLINTLNVERIRSSQELECLLPYLKLLVLSISAIPKDCELWYHGVTYRGMSVLQNPALLEKYNDYQQAFAPGTKVIWATPVSSTKNEAEARKFTKGIQYVIQGVDGKGGAGGVLLKNVSMFEEDEVLLEPPLVFEVVAATKPETVVVVVVRALPPKLTYMSKWETTDGPLHVGEPQDHHLTRNNESGMRIVAAKFAAFTLTFITASFWLLVKIVKIIGELWSIFEPVMRMGFSIVGRWSTGALAWTIETRRRLEASTAQAPAPAVNLAAGTILGADRLKNPFGVAVGLKGHILVSDTGLDRILIFNSDGSFAGFLGSENAADAQFRRPRGIAIDRQGRVVVADCGNDRILVLNADGSMERCFGSKGTAMGQFSRPFGVAVDSEGRIVVAEGKNHRIQIFSADGSVMRQFGSKGAAVGQFNIPTGVAVDGTGRIVVADSENHRVQVFNSDGGWMLCLGSEGDGPGQLKRPYGVAVDRDGRIVVADTGNDRVQVFNADGSVERIICAAGEDVGHMGKPCGVVVAPGANWRIVVAEGSCSGKSNNHRLQVF